MCSSIPRTVLTLYRMQSHFGESIRSLLCQTAMDSNCLQSYKFSLSFSHDANRKLGRYTPYVNLRFISSGRSPTNSLSVAAHTCSSQGSAVNRTQRPNNSGAVSLPTFSISGRKSSTSFCTELQLSVSNALVIFAGQCRSRSNS